MRSSYVDNLVRKLNLEARLANKHPLNLEAQRWRKEYALKEKIPFYVTPFGNSILQVDDFLVTSTYELEEQGVLGPERADVMREIVWDFPMSPMERTRWWVGIPGEEPTHLVKRLTQASNLQEAMVEVVEALHWNLITDSDMRGIYDPMGTLN